MGCLYSTYSTEDKKLILILKHLDCATKAQFLKLKEALRYRNDQIIASNGERNLTTQKLVCLNDIINGGFYTRVNSYSFYEPIWYITKNSNIFSDNEALEYCVCQYNSNDILEVLFFEKIKPVLLIGCRLMASILFF